MVMNNNTCNNDNTNKNNSNEDKNNSKPEISVVTEVPGRRVAVDLTSVRWSDKHGVIPERFGHRDEPQGGEKLFADLKHVHNRVILNKKEE